MLPREIIYIDEFIFTLQVLENNFSSMYFI
jgi:hypothetical protein